MNNSLHNDVLILADSFKGSLTNIEVSSVIKKAFEPYFSKIEAIPLSDGGEGSLACFQSIFSTQPIRKKFSSACGLPIQCELIITNNTAVLETAQCIGLIYKENTATPIEERTTHGIGEIILYCLKQNVSEIIITLGGSSTNDGGIGMLEALGVSFFSQNTLIKGINPSKMLHIDAIDFSTIHSAIKHTKLTILTDVNNPLLGDKGATYTYGLQKGLIPASLESMEKNMQHYSQLITNTRGEDLTQRAGAGSSGGLGYAFHILNGNFFSGAQYFLQHFDLENKIKKSRFVITAEGKSDEQTFNEKLPFIIAKYCRKYNVPVFLLAGCIETKSKLKLLQYFQGCFSTIDQPISLEETMKNARENLFLTATNLAQTLTTI